MAKSTRNTTTAPLPVAPIERLLVPVKRFLEIEAASGIVLLSCTILALVLANSVWAKDFAALWKTPVSFSLGAFELSGDVGHLIVNDALMTLFFFVVGLEVKREIVAGEFRTPLNALLPVVGAAGGAIVPAAIYLFFQWGEPGQRGWAIPMATDIAFVVGFLTLFGSRVPFGLKIFLLTLAIVDDLVAVLIITFVFTQSLVWSWLFVAAGGFVLVFALNRLGVRAIPIYVLVGSVIWIAFFKAGIHPTVAGVLLGLLTPASAWIGQETFMDILSAKWNVLVGYKEKSDELPVDVEKLQFVAREVMSPLHRLEAALHPFVAFLVMPVFALANAGVTLEPSALAEPVAIAVAVGLAAGKPLGILSFCLLAVLLGVTKLPKNVTWGMLAAGACLAGIGFSMALFLNALAFPEAEGFATKEAAGKIGVLAGSVVSAILGLALLWQSTRSAPTQAEVA